MLQVFSPEVEMEKMVIFIGSRGLSGGKARAALESSGVRSVDAADPAEAISLCTGGERPGLVALEISDPASDGAGLIREIRANEATRTVPVLVMTSEGILEDKMFEWKEAGATGWVTAPYTPEKISRMLEVMTF